MAFALAGTTDIYRNCDMNSERIYLAARDHLDRASAILRGTGRRDLCELIDEMARLLDGLRQEALACPNVIVLDHFRTMRTQRCKK